MSERRFKLVEDPEGDLSEDYVRTMIHPDAIPPASEPRYPEEQWTEGFCRRVEAAINPSRGPDQFLGRVYLERLYDDGLLVVERDKWERLEAERDEARGNASYWLNKCIKATRRAPDLRPTEEQVREAMVSWGWWPKSVDHWAVEFRKKGWLRDTEAPPTPLPAEVQKVLDLLGGYINDPTLWWPVVDAWRAYEATLPKEGEDRG